MDERPEVDALPGYDSPTAYALQAPVFPAAGARHKPVSRAAGATPGPLLPAAARAHVRSRDVRYGVSSASTASARGATAAATAGERPVP